MAVACQATTPNAQVTRDDVIDYTKYCNTTLAANTGNTAERHHNGQHHRYAGGIYGRVPLTCPPDDDPFVGLNDTTLMDDLLNGTKTTYKRGDGYDGHTNDVTGSGESP